MSDSSHIVAENLSRIVFALTDPPTSQTRTVSFISPANLTVRESALS
jgi:hypothetical protein